MYLSEETPKRTGFDSIKIGGIITALFGVCAFIGWIANIYFLTAIKQFYIPMAPSTALFFILLGLGVVFHQELFNHPPQRKITIFAACLLLVSSLILMVLSAKGVRLDIEHLGIEIQGSIFGADYGHISPITAFCFALAAVSYILMALFWGKRIFYPFLALLPALLLLLFSIILLIAYFLGGPLLYGGPFIPPALTTSIAFLILAVTLLKSWLKRIWPGPLWHRIFRDKTAPILLAIFIIFSLGIIFTGSAYFRQYRKNYHIVIGKELTSIAELKTEELIQWRKERMGDASLFFDNVNFSGLVKRYFGNSQDDDAKFRITLWMNKLITSYQYESITLTDTLGRIRLTHPQTGVHSCPHREEHTRQALAGGKVTFLDLHRSADGKAVHMSLLAPIYENSDRNKPLGVLILQIDPELYLYPMIGRWPTPVKTAECLLFRREGEEVVFLNPLRFNPEAALNQRAPISEPDLPAAIAARGHAGLVEGKDYRGVPVVAAVQPIPNSPWFIVAKRDKARILAPMMSRLWQTLGFVTILILSVVAGIGMMWRHQKALHLGQLLAASQALEKSRRALDQIFENMHDGVIGAEIASKQFVIVNDAICRMLGYSRREMLTLGVQDIHPVERLEELFRIFAEAAQGELPSASEIPMKRKDGSIFYADVSAARIEFEGKTCLVGNFRDITQRKQAEEAVRISEKLYRSLFENMLNGFAYCEMIFDEANRPVDFKYLSVNKTFEALTGLKDVMGKRVTEVIPNIQEADRELFEIYGKVAMTGEPKKLEFYLASLNMWFALSVYSPAKGYFVAVFDVITERKMAEKELRESRERLAGIVQAIPDFMSIIDDEYNMVWANEALIRAYGNVQYKKCYEVYHRTDAPCERCLIRKVLADGEMHQHEAETINTLGERVCQLSIAAVASTYPDGRPKTVIELSRDITDRKSQEERIKHLNRVLRTIRNVNQLIVREKDKGKLIQEACDLMVQDNGYSKAMIILTEENDKAIKYAYSGLGELPEEINAKLNRNEIHKCVREEYINGEVRVINKKDQDRENCIISKIYPGMDAMCSSLKHNTIRFGMVLVALEEGVGFDEEEQGLFAEMAGDIAFSLYAMKIDKDIAHSEQMRTKVEEQLIQAQKMEAVGRLAGGVAHDFNNLLTVIGGNAALGMMSLQEDDPLMHDLQQVQKAADKASKLTRQLLTFSRKQEVQVQIVDLNSVIRNLEKMLRRLISEDIMLDTKFAVDLWKIKADEGQLEQVIINLCVNARDAMPKGGKLLIGTSNEMISQEYTDTHAEAAPGEYVILSVSDTGTGIPKEIVDKIFEPFFTTKAKGEGTGLGLSTVYGIVKQAGGFINVYGELGGGSVFKIYLPRCIEEIEAAKEEVQAVGDLHGGETILVVEDEDGVRNIAVKSLRKFGYTVIEAENGGVGYLKCKKSKKPIDMIVTDVIMPEMNGKELIDSIREFMPQVKVLFISGYSHEIISEKGIIPSDVNFLNKPFEPGKFLQKVRQVLNKK